MSAAVVCRYDFQSKFALVDIVESIRRRASTGGGVTRSRRYTPARRAVPAYQARPSSSPLARRPTADAAPHLAMFLLERGAGARRPPCACGRAFCSHTGTAKSLGVRHIHDPESFREYNNYSWLFVNNFKIRSKNIKITLHSNWVERWTLSNETMVVIDCDTQQIVVNKSINSFINLLPNDYKNIKKKKKPFEHSETRNHSNYE